MARNREKIGSLTRQVQNKLDSKLAIGESKHFDKLNGGTQDKIYSWGTYKAYIKHCNYFVQYCKEEYGVRTLEGCRNYVDEWLNKRSEDGLSAYTQKLESSALAKMYDCSTKDFRKTDIRIRADITRSRGEKVRDKHFSEERNKDLIDFCKSTGLRRDELKYLTGDKLVCKEDKYYIKIDVGSKGGRYREVPIIGDVSKVVERMINSGTNRVFEKLPNGADIHGYRSQYATSYYNSIARDIKDIPYDKVNKGTNRIYQSQVYHCKGDLKGVSYDKIAMLEISRALGHNRISVIAGHYIKA